MRDIRVAMHEHFVESIVAATPASPFTAQLIDCLDQDFAAGGPVADLLGNWHASPRSDAVAMRVCGALHAAALTRRDEALAERYPERCPNWRMDEVLPAARAFLLREHDWVAEFIRSPPQTNETRRSIALLAAFLTIASDYDGVIDTFELVRAPA